MSLLFRCPCALASIIATALLTAFSAPSEVFACQCNRITPDAAAEGAPLIFVASPEPQQPPSGRGTPLRVRRVYKGVVADQVDLTQTDCSSPLDVLRPNVAAPDVLVYGYPTVDGVIAPDMCSRSAFLEDASEDLAFLEKTFGPAREVTPSPAAGTQAPPQSHSSTETPSTDTTPTTDATPTPISREDVGEAAPQALPPGPRGCSCTQATDAAVVGPTSWLAALAAIALLRRRELRRSRSLLPAD